MAEVPTNCSENSFVTPDGCAVKCTRFCADSDGRQILLFTAYDCDTDAFSNQYWDVSAGAFIPPEPLVDCDSIDDGSCDDNRVESGETFCAVSDGRPIILYSTFDCVTDTINHLYWDVSAGAFISAEPLIPCDQIGANNVFGENEQYAADVTNRCTIDKVLWTTQLMMTTPALNAGTYRWNVFFEHSQDNASKSMDWRLTQNGVQFAGAIASTDDNQITRYEHLNKFGMVVLTAGVKNILLQFKLTALTGTFQACMRDARFSLWRVS